MTDPRPADEDGAQERSVVEERQSSGDARVDQALTRLAELDDLAVTEHVPVYDDVNRLLQDSLADLDEEQ